MNTIEVTATGSGCSPVAGNCGQSCQKTNFGNLKRNILQCFNAQVLSLIYVKSWQKLGMTKL